MYRLERVSVMVVDDNRYMLTLIAEILRGLGIRDVHQLTNAADAFKEMQICPVDLVFCDHSMEPLSGIEFVQLLRTSADSPDRFVPVIMVTGYSDYGTVVEARDAGVTEFLTKPIQARAAYSRVLEVINHPRPFVQCKSYFGPDRRRRDMPHNGPERRKSPPTEDGADGAQLIAARSRAF